MFNMLNRQINFFNSGVTKDYEFRLNALKKLKNSILSNESLIYEALKKDLNKSENESYLTEIGIVLDEISFAQKNLKKWMNPQKIMPSIAQLPGRCFSYPEPYGNTLILSPWNYPIQLSLNPLIGAIAAGNTAIIKPSEFSVNSTKAIKKIISVFDEEYICVVEGAVEETTALLELNFDYIFFTGSTSVGKIIMQAAAKNLTPVTLELGGKSPAIVDSSADVSLSAKRIAFGKVINSGQTCVAPDYLLLEEKVKDDFIYEYGKVLREIFNENFQKVNIINQTHYNRLKNLISGNIILGGSFNDSTLSIEPTVISDVTLDSPIMQEEIFGPILPLITYKNLDEAIECVKTFEKPLALYIFSNNEENINKIIDNISFGAGCINDTLMHLSSPKLPFGGVGASGMGSYHGKKSFDTFTHYKNIFKQVNFFDNTLKYSQDKKSLNLIKKIIK